MADVAAARREARRRRILENSGNRLQLISGKNVDDIARASPVRSLHSEDKHDVSPPDFSAESRCSSRSSVNNGLSLPEPEVLEFLSTITPATANNDNEIMLNDTTIFPGPTSEVAKEPNLWEKLITYRYDVVLLSIILQVLYNMSSVPFDNVYFFLPVAIYDLMKLIWAPVKETSGLANILLLLNGMSSVKVQKLLFVSQIVKTFAQDVCVFLFVTICIQSLYIMLIDLFNT